jgi:hypothetical protein
LKSSIEAADNAARRAFKDGGKKLADANKAVNKARRLANRALDFEEEEESLTSSDYEVLLSAAGAVEKTINVSSTLTQTFSIPPGSKFCWKVRVKKHDIGFAVREVKEGEPSLDIEPFTRYRFDTSIQGRILYQITIYSLEIHFYRSTTCRRLSSNHHVCI